jgi:hypothetical protein
VGVKPLTSYQSHRLRNALVTATALLLTCPSLSLTAQTGTSSPVSEKTEQPKKSAIPSTVQIDRVPVGSAVPETHKKHGARRITLLLEGASGDLGPVTATCDADGVTVKMEDGAAKGMTMHHCELTFFAH